jgi:hypothetical protein
VCLWLVLPQQHGLYVWVLQGLLCCDACHGIKVEQSTDKIVVAYEINSVDQGGFDIIYHDFFSQS